jgi:hypothetical protein
VPPRSGEKYRKIIIIRGPFRLDKEFINRFCFFFSGIRAIGTRDYAWAVVYDGSRRSMRGTELRPLRSHLNYIMLTKERWICIIPCGKQLLVNLKEEDLETDSLDSYNDHVNWLCSSVEVKNWTGCSQFRESITDRYRHLRNSKSLLTDTVGRMYEDSRLRRRISNFLWAKWVRYYLAP